MEFSAPWQVESRKNFRALAGMVITAQGSMPLPSAAVEASHNPAMPKTGFA